MRTERLFALAFAALAFLHLALPLIAADSQNNARGLASNGVISGGDIDAVSLFNGGLTVAVPLRPGTFALNGGYSYSIAVVYTGNPWDFLWTGHLAPKLALPNRRSNAGLGWRVSLGRMIRPSDPTNPTCAHAACNDTFPGKWVYESPDGGDHVFYSTLHTPDADYDASASAFYTRDSSYLRLRNRITADGTVELDFPTGLTHVFSAATGRLTQIRTPYDSTLYPSVTVSDITPDATAADRLTKCHDDGAVKCWQVLEAANPAAVRFVTFENDPGADMPLDPATQQAYRVRRVILSGYANSENAYTFNYTLASAFPLDQLDPTPCYSRSTTKNSVSISLLNSITLPKDAGDSNPAPAYQFTYFNSPSLCSQGSMQTLTLPTGGTIEYTYTNYFAGQLDDDDAPYVPGVATRKKPGIAGTPTWTYTAQNDATPAKEMTVTVAKPGNAATEVHYFSVARTNDTTLGWKKEEYGLPLTHRSGTSIGSDGAARYLSTEIKDGTDVKRTGYVTYELDGFTVTSSRAADNNRRVVATHTTFNDDTANPPPTVDAQMSEFDLRGHYRQSSISNTGLTSPTRTARTEYNTTYDAGALVSLSLPAVSAPWTLETFRQASQTQGPGAVKSDACFNAQGQVSRVRSRRGTAPGGHDLITVFERDGNGNVIVEKRYGGDIAGTPVAGHTNDRTYMDITQNPDTLTSPFVDDLCSQALPTNPTYEIHHSYQLGLRYRSEYFAGGTAVPGPLLDVTNDVTGLVIRSRDAAGVETTYTHDALLRVKSVERPGMTTAQYTYQLSPLRVTETQGEISRVSEYDAYGRLTKESRGMPAGTATRTTEYNDAGEVKFVSEWDYAATPTHKTEYTYDALGRVTQITAPDSSKVQTTFAGVRTVTRTQKVATASENGSATLSSASTAEEYDADGRLISVTEPGGFKTTYSYDVANHLVGVCANGTPPCAQTRAFTYDGAGLLINEHHPEMADATYRYDAGGHVVLRTLSAAAAFDLRYTYDSSERLVEVAGRDTAPGFDRLMPMKTFEYGSANVGSNLKRGKLTKATRTNRTNGHTDVIVASETYDYSDAAGRRTTTTLELKELTTGSIVQTIVRSKTYDGLDRPSDVTYPHCQGSGGTPCGEASFTHVSPTYSNGLPSGVSGFGTFDYAASGMVQSVTHGNTVVDTYTPDASGMLRPTRIGFGTTLPCSVPNISTQPSSVSAAAGTSVTLTVSASGVGSLSYQWHYADGHAIAGATTNTYTVTVGSSPQSFYVNVTNACGVRQSDLVTVTASLTPPAWLTSSALRLGNGQWQISLQWAPVTGATGYTISRQTSSAGYQNIATNVSPTSWSDTVAPNAAYVYRIIATNSTSQSTPSVSRLETAISFTDLTTPALRWNAAPLDEIRQALNYVRAVNGDPPLSWVQLLPGGAPVPQQGAVISASHVLYLRSAINEARTTLQLSQYTFAVAVDARVTTLSPSHIVDLRGAVQ